MFRRRTVVPVEEVQVRHPHLAKRRAKKEAKLIKGGGVGKQSLRARGIGKRAVLQQPMMEPYYATTGQTLYGTEPYYATQPTGRGLFGRKRTVINPNLQMNVVPRSNLKRKAIGIFGTSVLFGAGLFAITKFL